MDSSGIYLENGGVAWLFIDDENVDEKVACVNMIASSSFFSSRSICQGYILHAVLLLLRHITVLILVNNVNMLHVILLDRNKQPAESRTSAFKRILSPKHAKAEKKAMHSPPRRI